jgi:CHAT domain-containing protein
VVCSLWRVGDFSTALLLGEFHESLYGRQMLPATALRSAQLWLKRLSADEALAATIEKARLLPPAKAALVVYYTRRQLSGMGSRPFENPFHWAAFQCVGNG